MKGLAKGILYSYELTIIAPVAIIMTTWNNLRVIT